MSNQKEKKWLDFIPQANGQLKCERCGKTIQPHRIARAAHAAKCLKQNVPTPQSTPTTKPEGKTYPLEQ